MTKPRFDPTVTLGQLLGMLPLIAFIAPFFVWVVTKNFAQDARLDVVEASVRTITTKLDEESKRSADAALDLRTGVRRLDDKLDRVNDRLILMMPRSGGGIGR